MISPEYRKCIYFWEISLRFSVLNIDLIIRDKKMTEIRHLSL